MSFDLVLSDGNFASICFPRFFWEPEIQNIKLTVAGWSISLMSPYSEIVTCYCRVILAYVGGVVRHTYMRFISLIIHASSLKMNTKLVLFQEVELRNSSTVYLSGKKNEITCKIDCCYVVEHMLYLPVLPECNFKTALKTGRLDLRLRQNFPKNLV